LSNVVVPAVASEVVEVVVFNDPPGAVLHSNVSRMNSPRDATWIFESAMVDSWGGRML
jgi:hypothetical protein